ncbi:MAG: hypothetical protein D5R99_03665 [Methanocalculus sp. MSAO_Arc1]|nr:MAG: hypothetical protein D5R99_03665 [Methanocalculus sp. MSAO_Arc1]
MAFFSWQIEQIRVLFFSALFPGLHTLPLPGAHAKVGTSQTDRMADLPAISEYSFLVAPAPSAHASQGRFVPGDGSTGCTGCTVWPQMLAREGRECFGGCQKQINPRFLWNRLSGCSLEQGFIRSVPPVPLR